MLVKFNFSLSRVWEYFQDKNFGIVSAYKGNLPKEKNEERLKLLQEYVRELGYGYREIKGVWTMNNEDGTKTVTFEYPLFIPNLTPQDAIAMGRDDYLPIEERLPQDAVLYTDGDKVVVDYLSTGQRDEYDKFEANFQKGWESWSEDRGRKWRYSSVTWNMASPTVRSSWMNAMADDHFKNLRAISTFDRSKEIEQK